MDCLGDVCSAIAWLGGMEGQEEEEGLRETRDKQLCIVERMVYRRLGFLSIEFPVNYSPKPP